MMWVSGTIFRMPDAIVVIGIRYKYCRLFEDLEERARRRWAATKAESIVRGGVAAVALAWFV
jgi:hypothetical protein